MFNNYPYTDYHELNTDWIISKIKNVETAEANTKQYAEDADAAKVAAEDAKDIAVAAKDDAVEAKDDAEDAKNYIVAAKDQLDLLQARVDNIIPDGTQTAGNTELLDIRVAADGTIWDSAGNAVRGQVTALENTIDEVSAKIINSNNLFDENNIETGCYYTSTNGGRIANASYCAFKSFDFTDNDDISVNTLGFLCFYNGDNYLTDFISGVVTTLNNGVYTTTVPVGTKMVIYSVGTNNLGLEHLMLVKSSTMPGYVKYGYEFAVSPREFKPYQSGLIFFNVSVNSYVYHGNVTIGIVQDGAVFETVPCVLQLPESYTHDGKPTKMIMIVHGAGYGVSGTTWGNSVNEADNVTSNFRVRLIDYLVANGYAVCDCNGWDDTFATTSWGCPRAVRAYRQLYDYVIKNYNIDPQIGVYGFSMGGINAINFTRYNRDIVKCLGLGAPITDVYGQCWNTSHGAVAGWRQGSAIAYDFADVGSVTFTNNVPPSPAEQQLWDDNKYLVVGHSPADTIVTINGTETSFLQLPATKVWQGSLDTAVTPAATQRFTDALKAGGSYVEYRYCDGGGHEICYGSNTNIDTEILYWFNRFN